MVRKYFDISNREKFLFRVRAENHQHAAEIAARKLFGKRSTAWRTTGDKNLSGFFQGYLPCKTGGSNSTGKPYHVTER